MSRHGSAMSPRLRISHTCVLYRFVGKVHRKLLLQKGKIILEKEKCVLSCEDGEVLITYNISYDIYVDRPKPRSSRSKASSSSSSSSSSSNRRKFSLSTQK
jgi:hypothetical protein